MSLASIVAMLKGFIPILEPIGEQGLAQLWSIVDAEVAKVSSPDVKEFLQAVSPAVKAYALAEMKKLVA